MHEFYDPKYYDLEIGPGIRLDHYYCDLISTGKVLDVGCGTGNLMLLLISKGVKVEGIDISNTMINAAREKFTDIPANSWKLTHADILSVSYKNKFDYVICSNELTSHLSTTDKLRKLMANTHMALKEGGNLILDILSFSQWASTNTYEESGSFQFVGAGSLDTRRELLVYQHNSFDQSRRCQVATFRYETVAAETKKVETVFYRKLQLHPWTEIEIRLTLELAGFRGITTERGAIRADPERIVISAKK